MNLWWKPLYEITPFISGSKCQINPLEAPKLLFFFTQQKDVSSISMGWLSATVFSQPNDGQMKYFEPVMVSRCWKQIWIQRSNSKKLIKFHHLKVRFVLRSFFLSNNLFIGRFFINKWNAKWNSGSKKKGWKAILSVLVDNSIHWCVFFPLNFQWQPI